MKASEYSIPAMFGAHSKLQIPFFQRNYVWDKYMCELYWETMEAVSARNFHQYYFLGSIVLKQEESALEDGDIRTVIDGQQRLITTLLFLKSVCEKEGNSSFFDKYYYIDKFKSKGKEREKTLKVARDDEEIFNAILDNEIDNVYKEKKKNNKNYNNKIYDCYDCFKSKSKEDLEKIDLDKILGRIRFVVIDIDRDQDEQQIFDTLNSIGVDLTTAELVKNYLFKGKLEQDVKDYDKYWKNVFEGNEREFWDSTIETGRGEKPNIEVFFQAFFDIYNKEAQSTDYDNAGGLAKKYKIFFKKKNIEAGGNARKAFLESLKEYAEIYRKNIDRNSILLGFDFDNPMDRINVVIHFMRNTTIVPYVLYVLKTFPTLPSEVNNSSNIPVEQKEALLIIESYIIRRIVCRESTNNYNKFFPWLLHNGYADYKKLKNYMHKLMEENNPTNRFPKDKQCSRYFNGEEGRISNKNIRAILYLLEQSLIKEENALVLRAINFYQVEHILPRAWDEKWKSFASNIENSHERENHISKYIIKFGNLTLITPKLNPSISNSDWATKKEGRDKNKSKGLKVCASGIRSFDKDEYLRADEWKEGQIDERTKELYNLAIKIWAEPMADKQTIANANELVQTREEILTTDEKTEDINDLDKDKKRGDAFRFEDVYIEDGAIIKLNRYPHITAITVVGKEAEEARKRFVYEREKKIRIGTAPIAWVRYKGDILGFSEATKMARRDAGNPTASEAYKGSGEWTYEDELLKKRQDRFKR